MVHNQTKKIIIYKIIYPTSLLFQSKPSMLKKWRFWIFRDGLRYLSAGLELIEIGLKLRLLARLLLKLSLLNFNFNLTLKYSENFVWT